MVCCSQCNDSRINLCRQVAADAKEYFGAKMFPTVIPRNVRLAEARASASRFSCTTSNRLERRATSLRHRELVRRTEALSPRGEPCTA